MDLKELLKQYGQIATAIFRDEQTHTTMLLMSWRTC